MVTESIEKIEAKRWGSRAAHPSHEDWDFRSEAVLWVDGRPVEINFRPYASQLRAWMLRTGHIEYLIPTDRKFVNAPDNPYSLNASNLAMAYSGIVNDSHTFATSSEKLSRLEAEVKYLRLSSELVLYSARLGEALIKQLLYCTDFLREQYDMAALGGLMSGRCIACYKAGQKHFIALLGSLGHRYGLCRTSDKCLNEKMKIVNAQRNATSAHSGALELLGRTVGMSKKQMLKDLDGIGTEFIHVLNHISDLEERMTMELQAIHRFGPHRTIEVKDSIRIIS